MQEVERNRLGVVGVEQLLALLAELREAAALTGYLGFRLSAHPGHRLGELVPHPLDLAGGQPHLAVDALDRGLDQVDRDVGLLATRSPAAAEAEEVGVAAAIALGPGEAHAGAAAPAVERALQVVVVLSVLLGGAVVGGEDGLGFGEGRAVDQVLVPALVLDPGVADHTDVVGVLEHRRELAPGERLRRVLRGGPGPQAALGEGGEQGVERVGTRAVGGESPADMRRPLGIDFDRAEFPPLDHLPHVQVADRRSRWGAAELCLLRLSLHRLGSEVGRVELGVGGDDRVHEAADRSAIDVLGDGDQLDAGFMQRVGDSGVVVAVAGEAIDLVDDHEVQVALRLQPSEQRLEFGAVGGLRRLATIDVLGYDFRIKLGGLRLASLPLGRDRIALGVTASARLRRRRDPQVDRRPLHRRRLSPVSGAPVAGCSPRRRCVGRAGSAAIATSAATKRSRSSSSRRMPTTRAEWAQAPARRRCRWLSPCLTIYAAAPERR
ncbi:MAG TPA: hypothetical protein VGI73_14155 [Solirubrobacterales bacterium]